MWTILILLVNIIDITLVLDRIYEFMNKMTIPYLTYSVYSQMDVAFDNPMQYLKSCKWCATFWRIHPLEMILPVPNS